MEGHFAVIGAGRQGTAAAYDLARYGQADEVFLADRDMTIARQAAERLSLEEAAEKWNQLFASKRPAA